MKLNAKRNFGTSEVLDRDQMKNIKGGNESLADRCENIRSYTSCYQGSTYLGTVSGSFGCSPGSASLRCLEDFGSADTWVCYCID